MLFNDQYAISPYHLQLLKVEELLDFVDFPFLVVEQSPDGRKFLSHFVSQVDGQEHRILTEVSHQVLFQFYNGNITLKQIFDTAEKGHVFSTLTATNGKIEKAFQIPLADFQNNNPIQEEYELPYEIDYHASGFTDYHAKYLSYHLSKRNSSNSVDKLANALVDAQVQLNPHQVDAALFAFQSPLSKGVILADEVGLGKTIEAGLVISQKWAERKRKILIIVPSSLRKQWSQELLDKFFLPSYILESKSFNDAQKTVLNPFELKDIIVITSYHFVKSKDVFVQKVDWDLVVIDEAHRLRNVYKPTNKIGNAIKNALAHVSKKILLTATPLQNSLMELYGLVSLIDDYAFGDVGSFRTKYNSSEDGEVNFNDLKERLAPICKRTLRKQVLKYIPYTKRVSFTEKFEPNADEIELYDLVSEYLQSPKLYALPSSQRHLMTLILRKLLASSTYAITHTLKELAIKLESVKIEQPINESAIEQTLASDFEDFENKKEDWEEEEENQEEENPSTEKKKKSKVYAAEDLPEIQKEIASLKDFAALAESIKENSKGVKLMTALENGFRETQARGGNRKAIIFTESTRTQTYLLNDVLENSGFKGKVVLFNGSNNDEKSKTIYKAWLEKHKGTDRISNSKTANMRSALVEHFRDEAEIMIATEAAAEGINLQFCSLIVNYDLPWNPQRIEQRIGRCHRYGQKHDVVVVNFLNTKNKADERVYELLHGKLKLFDGVFGASDEVLGIIGTGVDFEKRISEIYQTCRHESDIKAAFDQLQEKFKPEIIEEMSKTKLKLLENFDSEVTDKLDLRKEESENSLNKYERWLWDVTKIRLQNEADFNEQDKSFLLKTNPFDDDKIQKGLYRLKKNVEDANTYRLGHPLAKNIIESLKALKLKEQLLQFHYTGLPKITMLENLRGQSGWLTVVNLAVSSFEDNDFILHAAVCDDGTLLDDEQASKLMELMAAQKKEIISFPELREQRLHQISQMLERRKSETLDELGIRDMNYFTQEMDKLDKWAEDRRTSSRQSIREIEVEIRTLKREAKLAPNLPERLAIEKKRKERESALDQAYRENDLAVRDIEKQKEGLLDSTEKKMKQGTHVKELFTIRWKLY